MRFAQSLSNVRGGLSQMRLAISTNVTRTSTLAKAAGVIGLFCFWLGRRSRSRPGHPWGNAVVASGLGLLLTFLMRYGKSQLGTVLR